MAAPEITKSKTSQIINLEEEFGIDFSDKDSLKEAIGQAIIDRIISRTQSGDGMAFSSNGAGRSVKLKAPYSDKYAKSAIFKAFGKSKGNVNMELTGDMLSSIDILSIDDNSIEIGITDSDEVLKSFNHNTGDTVPRRPFFGVSKTELKEIRRSFGDEIKEIITIGETESKKAFNTAVTDLIEKIKSG